MMIQASCHCSAVTLTLAHAPTEVTECTCSICRRYAVLWAYYPLAAVTISTGPTERYMWGKRSISFHRCGECGCLTHWWPEGRLEDRMGVNARLMNIDTLSTVRVRHLDGAGSEQYID